MSDDLKLVVNGDEYRGWKSVAVARGIEQGPWSFELTVAPELDDNLYAGIEMGSPAEVYVDDEKIFTGYIDETPVNYTSRDYTINVVGRSKIGDLVDCSSTSKKYPAGLSLQAIAETECKPYGISVTIDQTAQDAARQAFTVTHGRDSGQSPWDFLEKLARIRAVLLISNADGGLTITRTGTSMADVQLVLGKNIKACQGQRSSRSLFSRYEVISQQPNLQSDDMAIGSQNGAYIVVGDSRRYRPCLTESAGPADRAGCLEQAKWQSNVNRGRSCPIVYTVQGWRQTLGGRLWMPNELIDVTDKRLKLDAKQFLITEPRLMLTKDGGRETQLTLMLPETFDMIASAEGEGQGNFLL